MKKNLTDTPFGTWIRCGMIVVSLLCSLPLAAQPKEPPVNPSAHAASRYYEPYEVRLPAIVLKTNLLYGLTTTLNLGMEIGLAPQWTLEIPVNYNPWRFNDDTRLRHLGVQPEIRYWTCERFSGWFFGLHGHYAKFNVGGLPEGIFSENMQKNRYQGYLYGGGVSAGYSWILKKRWSMEATLGAGYARIEADKYPCAVCGTGKDIGGKNYWGITRVGLSLIYVIK